MPNGKVYIVGGFVKQDQLFQDVECYDVDSNHWTMAIINLKGYPRSGPCVVPHGSDANKFYIIGGRDELREAEYDEEEEQGLNYDREILEFDVETEKF